MILWGALVIRAGMLQIFPNKRLQTLQDRQFQTTISLQNRRGAIVDRFGRDLALSTTSYSVFADPKIIDNKKGAAKRIARVLGHSPQTTFGKIKDPKRRFVWIERFMDKQEADEIKALQIRGLQVVEEFKRVYPNDTLLANVMGFVGREGQGLEGIELFHNAALEGNKKKVAVRRDARGRPLVVDGMMFAENPDGAELKLTVDSELQHALEKELEHATQFYDADNAIGVILDAKTSAVLAMASTPLANANNAMKLAPAQRRNRAVTDSFEPGSTMKTFVVATALKEKILAPNTKYNTENGILKIGKRIIREAESNAKHTWAQLTAAEILAYSSNIGTAKIAFELGSEKLRQGLLDFGFGQKTDIDLPGDVRGNVLPLPWSQHLEANISFGHGIATSALQVANAYAAIANGGTLNTPYIVQSIRDPETGKTTEFEPKAKRQVLSAADAASLRLMLTGVTAPGGTGVNAKVDGFLIGGKTGTAQKVDPNGRGYMSRAYLSSFAGFIPATDPRFVIYVMVDHPKKEAYYGSVVAAPIFSRIASFAVRKAGLAPVLLSEKNLVGDERKLAQKEIKNKKDKSAAMEKIERALAVAEGEPGALAQGNEEIMPDLSNLTAREVIKRLSGMDLEVRIRGDGVVAESWPPAGSALPKNKKVNVLMK